MKRHVLAALALAVILMVVLLTNALVRDGSLMSETETQALNHVLLPPQQPKVDDSLRLLRRAQGQQIHFKMQMRYLKLLLMPPVVPGWAALIYRLKCLKEAGLF